MKQYSLLLVLLVFFTAAWSQDSLNRRDKALMQTLNMNLQGYQAFSKAIKTFDQKLIGVQKNPVLSFEEKKKAIESLHQQKQQYINTHLSQDQQDKLKVYYKANEHHSQAYLKRQQQVEKLKQSEVKKSSPSN